MTLNQLCGSCCLGIFILACWVLAWAFLSWIYHDVKERGGNPWLWVIFVLLFGWPIYLIWYLIRPPKGREDPYSREVRDWSYTLRDKKGSKEYEGKEILEGTYRCPKCGKMAVHVEHDNSALCYNCYEAWKEWGG